MALPPWAPHGFQAGALNSRLVPATGVASARGPTHLIVDVRVVRHQLVAPERWAPGAGPVPPWRDVFSSVLSSRSSASSAPVSGWAPVGYCGGTGTEVSS